MPHMSQIVIDGSSAKRHSLCVAPAERLSHAVNMKSVDKNGGPVALRAWRAHRKLSQAALAEAVGTNPNMIGYLESGERALTVQWMRRLARALNVKPGQLIDDQPGESEIVGGVQVVNVERLIPVLSFVLQRAPKAGWKERDAGFLARVISDALELVPSGRANPPTESEFEVAVNAAFRLSAAGEPASSDAPLRTP